MSRNKRNTPTSGYNKTIQSIANLTFDELNSLEKSIPVILNAKIQSDLSSSEIEKAIEAGLYVEKQRIKNLGEQKSILFLPDSIGYSGKGYKENLGRVSFQTLQRMSNLYCVKNIITTRIEQVTRFLKYSNDEQKEGFTIRKKRSLFDADNNKKLSKEEQKKIEYIVDFLDRGGRTDKWELPDTFITFVRKIMQDSLSIDQVAFEITRSKGWELDRFRAVDGSMIRLLDSVDPNYEHDFERYRFKGVLPRYCQVFEQQIVFNKQLGEYVLYYPWELGFGVRNVNTDIWNNGYGKSELESLIEIVTYILNGVQYNGNFFKNGSNPKGFIKMNGTNTNEVQLNEFKQRWRQLLTGTENSHRIPIFSGVDLEWVDLHHCLHPDSKVWTKEGQFTLSEILDGKDDCLCEIWDGLNFSKSRVFRTGKKRLCETEFLNRCSIKTSPDHRFLVLRGDEPEWVHQKDLVVGDFVFVNKRTTDSFMYEIGFIQQYKNDNYLEREKSSYVLDEAPVSFIRDFAMKLRSFYKKLDKNDQFLTKIERHDLQNISSGNQKASLSKVLSYAEKMNYPTPSFLRDFNLTRVSSIRVCDEEVEMVDVEMFNESHQFIANGVVVHNSNRDMEFDNWTKFLMTLLCSVYRIDPSELGFQFKDAAQVFGQDGQKQRLDHSKQKGLYPLLIFLQDLINKYIVSEIDEDMEFVFTGIEVEDEEKQVELDSKKIQSGMVSLQDMFRKYSGRELDEEKDIILNPVYLQVQQAKQFGGQGMNGLVDEESGEQGEIPNPFMDENPIAEKAFEYIDTILQDNDNEN